MPGIWFLRDRGGVWSKISGTAMLWLIQRLFFGPESELATSKPPEDLRAGQMIVLWPLAVLMLVMGVAPGLWLPAIEKSVHLPQLAEKWKGPTVMSPPVLPIPTLAASQNEEGER